MAQNNDQTWFVLDVTVAAAASEAIEFALNELDAHGTEINNLGVKPTDTIRVTGYFNEMPDDSDVQFRLSEALRIYGFSPEAIHETNWRRLGNVDWLFEWKKHWRATETDKFIIAPTWEKIDETDKIIIRIEPSMAFGTGTHETTRLCLKAIGENFESAMSFLDVGTGTGILAIAAAKLMSRNSNLESPIAGCDTDEDSIRIAAENAALNETKNIKFYVGPISAQTSPFDLVCANLTADVISPILPLLLEKSKRILILSGILKEQEDLIVSELRKLKVESLKVETLGEWISIVIDNG